MVNSAMTLALYAGNQLPCPPFPLALSYVWQAWVRLRRRTPTGFNGPNPITIEAIDAFIRRTGLRLSAASQKAERATIGLSEKAEQSARKIAGANDNISNSAKKVVASYDAVTNAARRFSGAIIGSAIGAAITAAVGRLREMEQVSAQVIRVQQGGVGGAHCGARNHRADSRQPRTTHQQCRGFIAGRISGSGRCIASETNLGDQQLKKIFKTLQWQKPSSFKSWLSDVRSAPSKGYAIDDGNMVRGVTISCKLCLTT